MNPAAVKDYHNRQAKALADGRMREVFVQQSRGVSILGVELGAQLVLQPARRIQTRAAAARGQWQPKESPPAVDSAEELPGWQALADDTRLNETIRRRAIHQRLAELGPVPPKQITRWLYKEVLHADLDDPYLGLGKILFDGYPFREEDEN